MHTDTNFPQASFRPAPLGAERRSHGRQTLPAHRSGALSLAELRAEVLAVLG